MAVANFAVIISLSVAASTLISSDDIIDPFSENLRWKRADDYGTGVGGPVAAGPVGPSGSNGHNNSTVDECPTDSSDIQRDSVKNSNTSQCSFEKRSNQVLSTVKIGDNGGQQLYKALKTAVCATEKDCIQQCLASQCTYFIRNTRDERVGLAFFYNLNEKTLRDDQYSSSNFFTSYVQVCQSANYPIRHASKRDTSLPRKRPIGAPAMTYGRSQTPSSMRDATESDPKLSLPRKRPQGSTPSPKHQNRPSSTKHDSPEHDTRLPLPRKRPPGSPPITYSRSSTTVHKTSETKQINGADAFKKFMHTFGKKYSGQEDARRSKIFQENVQRINKLNANVGKVAGKDGALYGWTPFADQTYDEFRKSHTGALPESNIRKLNVTDQDFASSVKSRPASVDWRQRGVIGRVRTQGSCGSCYAFSSADLISAQNAIDRGQSPKTLSAQYLADCASDNAGCGGARVGNVMDYVVTESKGVPLEQCYRYQEKAGTCRKEKSCCLFQTVKWSETLDASGPSEKDIIAGLLQWGPVVSVVEASEAWQFHNGTGIIKSSQCANGTGHQDHAILLIGYDYSGATPYYYARNSWGEDWGERGYAKLEAGTNACSVANTIVTACAHDCDNVKDARSRLNSVPPSRTQRVKSHT